jgi:hypothetical protein
MATSNYKRVSQKRVCCVCGKPDWCSYTPDEKISFCARITTGADRVSRTGWGVFYHEKLLFPIEPLPFPRRPPAKKAEIAPPEIRDFAYRRLIELAPASRSKEIIDGEKGLRARKILDFESYGSLPQAEAERRELAKIIRNSVNRQFPDYVRKRKSAIAGLPGFWIDKSGKVRLWTEKDYACPLMLIPYRNENGLVQACQIRFMCRAISGESNFRYVWLSTPEKSNGIGCGSPLHFTKPKGTTSKKPFLITEGALKAETAQVFKLDFDIIASGGVTCSHDEIIAQTRFRPLYLGFDNDCAENAHVARAVAKLIASRFDDGVKYGYDANLRILAWNKKAKGIDDALLGKISISSITPREWFTSLSPLCRDEVEKFFKPEMEMKSFFLASRRLLNNKNSADNVV